MRRYSSFFLVLLILLMASSSVNAQQVRFSIDGGTSKPVGENQEMLHWGFSVGGSVFFNIIGSLWLGGRIAYDRWGFDEAELLERVTRLNIIDPQKHSDAGEALEVVPAVRLMSNYPVSPINFFLHGGAGIYVLNLETKISGFRGTEEVTDIFGSDMMRFGMQLGGGIILGSPTFLSIELFPLYHLVFNGNNGGPFQFFSINLGVGLGI
ncbi:MAG: hypothetical protein LBI42_13695 [Chitinispirillales bacterium]|jgi:hypothetical protein|nr:hypothetical protein [Chitinispirillales bacterium]